MIELVYQAGVGAGHYSRMTAIQEALGCGHLRSTDEKSDWDGPTGYDVRDRKHLKQPYSLVIDNWHGGVMASRYDNCVLVSMFPYSRYAGNAAFLLGPSYAPLRKPFWEDVTPPKIVDNPERPFTYKSYQGTLQGFQLWGPEHYAGRDLAIVEGGVIVYELLRCGIPTIVVPANMEQHYNVRMLDEQGAIRVVSSFARAKKMGLSRAARQSMQDNGLRLVDGQGAHRIAGALQ